MSSYKYIPLFENFIKKNNKERRKQAMRSKVNIDSNFSKSIVERGNCEVR